MDFKNIPVKYQPAYIWFWNAPISREGIKRRIEEMYEMGIRAFCVWSISKTYRPSKMRTYLEPEYLSEEYFDLLEYSFQVAKAKGMYCWLYDESGCPSGMACGQVRSAMPECGIKSFDVLEEVLQKNTPLKLHETAIAAFCGEQRVFEGDTFSEDTTVKQYIYFNNDRYDIAALRPDNADVKANEYYIKITHEKLKEKFGDAMGTDLIYMFDDESNMGDWTVGFESIFKETYGYDIEDYMPYITHDKEPQTVAQYRAKSDYHKMLGDLLINNYFSLLREWCQRNNMLSLGHLNVDNQTELGSIQYGHYLNVLRAFDIPGVDAIWEQIKYPKDGRCCFEGNEFFPRLGSSAAHQQGHNMAFSESMAVYGAQSTPELMRFVYNYQAVRGISIFAIMVISYDKESVVSLQHRPVFINNTPSMSTLGDLNDYTARISYLLQESRQEVKTALYCPYRTICGGGEKGRMAIDTYEALGHMLEEQGVDFDIIDETWVEGATLENGILKTEHVAYESVFVPEAAWEKPEIINKMKTVGEKVMPVIRRQNSKLISKKLIWKDGSEAYFICNFDNKTVSETIGILSNKNVCKLNLYTGEYEEMEAVYDGKMCSIPISLHRGDGILLWFSDSKISAKPIAKSSERIMLSNFESYISRRYTLDIKKGISYDNCEKPQVLKKDLNEWEKGFSGEVTYLTTLPEIPTGEYILDLGEVRHTAKVFVNDKAVGEAIMPPYQIYIGQVKEGDVLKIKVENTAANAYICNKEYFAVQNPGEVSVYYPKMAEAEMAAEAGGLIGPVNILKI